ncbi:hypothetical protein [Nocardia sp. SYP-A9097]|uniref:hypothetical protein n=1 Tax=Nocardia sp. SYP-A9097 TaxID=2663237 RepID=UPI001E415C17|nr:hypothetical protein [Nocardia sp. SYP-A9097]
MGQRLLRPKGIEYELLLTATTTALTLTGPGTYALDHYIPTLRAPGLRNGFAALLLALVTAAIVLTIRN